MLGSIRDSWIFAEPAPSGLSNEMAKGSILPPCVWLFSCLLSAPFGAGGGIEPDWGAWVFMYANGWKWRAMKDRPTMLTRRFLSDHSLDFVAVTKQVFTWITSVLIELMISGFVEATAPRKWTKKWLPLYLSDEASLLQQCGKIVELRAEPRLRRVLRR